MARPVFRKFIILFGVFLAIWLGIRYLLPLALPFLIGTGLALAADPLVHHVLFCQHDVDAVSEQLLLGVSALSLAPEGRSVRVLFAGSGRLLPDSRSEFCDAASSGHI